MEEYENKIIESARVCESISDVVQYGQVIGVFDIEDFVELVLFTKKKISEYRTVKNA